MPRKPKTKTEKPKPTRGKEIPQKILAQCPTGKKCPHCDGIVTQAYSLRT